MITRMRFDSRFKAIIISSFVVGLIAHAFIFLNATYGLDNVVITLNDPPKMVHRST